MGLGKAVEASRRAGERPAAAADTDEGRPLGRLIAVVVGIDHYDDELVADLTCSVNDAESVASAIGLAQPPDDLDLTLLTAPAREKGVRPPTRANLLDAMQRAARLTAEHDTALFYFGGHGGLIEGRPCLFPSDVDYGARDVAAFRRSAVGVDELQAAFDSHTSGAHRCTRRVMLLDCCQNAMDGATAPDAAAVASAGATRALEWRTGGPASADLVESFQHLPRGWSLVLSCSPGEVSLEDKHWGEHGIFSHFLSFGLRGEGDLGGDGTVSLAELAQFLADRVAKQARAILAELREQGDTSVQQESQNPTLIWGGPIAVPLTRRVDEGRAGFQPRVLGLWRRYLTKPLPYALHVEGMVRYGTAFLYGCLMALTVLLFAPSPGAAPWPWLAAGAGVVSGLLWIAMFVLAGAASECRWHKGGYVTSTVPLAWHVALFVLLVAFRARGAPSQDATAPALRLGLDLFILITLLVMLGFNELQCILALATMVKQDKRVALRRAFEQLKRRWIHGDIPNVLAMVSAAPKLYQVVGLGCSLFVVGHAVYLLSTGALTPRAGVALARDVVLLVFIQWQVQWFAASYRILRGRVLPEE